MGERDASRIHAFIYHTRGYDVSCCSNQADTSDRVIWRTMSGIAGSCQRWDSVWATRAEPVNNGGKSKFCGSERESNVHYLRTRSPWILMDRRIQLGTIVVRSNIDSIEKHCGD